MQRGFFHFMEIALGIAVGLYWWIQIVRARSQACPDGPLSGGLLGILRRHWDHLLGLLVAGILAVYLIQFWVDWYEARSIGALLESHDSAP